ncbi:MAG TPA: lipopolysaccharide kinase InaA family protein [Desulfomonilia bacterium]
MMTCPLSGYRIIKTGDTTIIVKEYLPENIIPASGPIGRPSSMTGRGNMRLLGDDMIVRELVHGGLFGKVTGRLFLSKSRSVRELRISNYLIGNGIRTPEIPAVRFIRSGIFYSIDVISRLVPNSIDLLTWLEKFRAEQKGEVLRFAQNNWQDNLFTTIFHETGSLVRRMHDLGVWHADLHLKNILLDEHMNPWIIDLDKALHLPVLPGFMRRMNLNRFFRSCKKWTGKGMINLLPDYRTIFLDGYNS